MANYDAYDPYDGATQFQSNQQNQPAPQADEVESTDKSLNSDQKKAVIAAGVGTAALGGAAYGLSMLEDGENRDLAEGDGSDADGEASVKLAAHTTPAPRLPVLPATPVDPLAGLTGFDKAFHEARMAFGAGHTFQYEGGTYNTYTKEEEARLTPEERNMFLASNNLVPEGHGHSHHQPSGTALASTDPDNFPSVTIDDEPHGRHHDHVASNEPSVSVIADESASVSIDSESDLHDTHLQDHTTDPVATLDDHLQDDHHNSMHDFNDPAHDFDNHADVSDFT